MIRLIWAASVHARYFMQRYMPTNILLDAIRTRRRGLKWGVPAMLLAIPYLLIRVRVRDAVAGRRDKTRSMAEVHAIRRSGLAGSSASG